MIDIAEINGLPLRFDLENERFVPNEDIVYDNESYIQLSDLEPILLNKYLRYPEKVYWYYKNIHDTNVPQENDVSYDIIYLPFGLLGIEFIKTHIFSSSYCENKCDAVIEVLYGNLTVVIQKNKEKEDPYEFETYVEAINIITLRKGEKLVIPTGVYYTFVNTGVVPVIFSKIGSKTHIQTDYSIMKRERGLAYFLISKNAKIEIVANPRYKIDCKLKCASLRRLMSEEDSPYIMKETHSSRNSLYKLFAENILSEVLAV